MRTRNIPLHIDFYNVQVAETATCSFEDAIASVMRIPADEHRNFDVPDTDSVYRMQVATHSRGGAYEADMVRIRMDHLPNRASLSGEIEPMDLDDDEGVGEETAFLYDPAIRILAIQRNRYGASSGIVARYFERMGNIGAPVYFDPVLPADVMRKVDRMRAFKKIEVSFARIRNYSIFRQEGPDLDRIMKIAEQYNAPTASFTVSMGKNRGSLNRDESKDLIHRLRRLAGHGNNIKRIRISGSSTDEDSQVIDLLEGKMTETIFLRSDFGRRDVPYNDHRKNAVREAFQKRREELARMFQE